MIGHIYIYGAIGKSLGGVEMLDVVSALRKNRQATELHVHINSVGGEVETGYQIAEELRSSGKVITTIIEGQCYSIATIVALAGDVRLIQEGSEFMIHNPWTDLQGDVEHIEAAAKEMRAVEDRIISTYSEITGISKTSIDALMKVETYLSAEKAIELGFLTGYAPKQQAVAILHNKEKMNVETVTKFEAVVNNLISTLKNWGVPKEELPKIVALEVTTADGKIMTVTPADGVEDGLIQQGDLVTIDGQPASGEYVMPDGSIVVVTEGKVSENKAAATPEETPKPANDNSALLEELNAKIAALETENSGLKNTNEAIEQKFTSLEGKFNTIQAALKNVRGVYEAPVSETVFNSKAEVKPVNAFAAAMEERKKRNNK